MFFTNRKNALICLLTTLVLSLILYTFLIFNVTHVSILYFPVVILVFLAIYNVKLLFNLYTTGYLLCTSIYIIFILLKSRHNLTLLEVTNYGFLSNILFALILVLIICVYFFHIQQYIISRNNKISNNISENTTNSITDYNSNTDTSNDNTNMCNSSKSDIKPIDMIKNQSFTDQLNVALTSNSIAMPIISNITYTHINGANEHNNSYDVTAVIKSNSKSIYNLSTDLKNDIENVYSLCNNVNKHTLNLKESILDCEAFIKDLSRYNFNLSSSHNNIQIDLKKANDSTNALKELLIKLENLSVITTHLANKTTLEKTYTQTNNDVLDFISKEFNSYANEIRRAIIQMSSIFNDFEKSYAQCNNEIKHNGDLIASYGLTLKQFNNTLTDITHNLNCIVRSTDSIDTTITRSKINTRHLVADASELRANVSHFAKTSYSISKLSK